MSPRHSSSVRSYSSRGYALTLLAGLLLVLVRPAPVHAEPTIEVVEAGWDEAGVAGTWTPVRVKLTGDDRDRRVLVEVIAQNRFQTGPNTFTGYTAGSYGQFVALAAGSARDVTLWFPSQGEPGGRVRMSVDDEVLAESDLSLPMVRPGFPLIGVLAEAAGVARTLRGIELSYQGLPLPLAVTELSPEDIAADPARLQALSAIVVQGNAATQLTDAQREAVLQIVRRGSDLLLAGGQAARVLPAGTLPVTYSGVATAPVSPALRTWLPNSAEPPQNAPYAAFQAKGGDVIAGSADAPLAWRIQEGLGSITLLGVDPSLEPLASWAGNSDLLRTALAPALPENTGVPGPGMPPPGFVPPPGYVAPDASGRLQTVVGILPREAQTGWPVAGAVLAVFALLVGPVFYILLRRIDRREFLWIAVPAASLAVVAVLYVWGVQGSGRDLVANVATYIEIEGENQPARQSVAVSFFGPTHQQLSLALPADLSIRAVGDQVSPYAPSQPGSSQAADPPFRMIEGGDRLVHFNSGQYGRRTLLFDRVVDDAPRVTAEIALEGGQIAGTLRNDSNVILEDAAVIVGTSLVPIGKLAPGESVPVRLSAPTSQVGPFPGGGGSSLSQALFGKGPAPPGAPPGYPGSYPTDPELQRRALMLDGMLMSSGPGSAPFGRSIPLTFTAFTRARTVEGSPLPEGHPSYQLTLLRQTLQLSLAPGPFVMPAGMVPGTILEPPSQSGYNPGGGGPGGQVWFEVRGSVTFSFKAPVSGDARVDALVLTTEQMGVGPLPPGAPPGYTGKGPPGPVEPAAAGLFSLYDWQRSTWVPLEAGGHRTIPAASYVGPGGEVRIRAAVSGGDSARVVQPTLALEGTVGVQQ
jgi:hypothetical protein